MHLFVSRVDAQPSSPGREERDVQAEPVRFVDDVVHVVPIVVLLRVARIRSGSHRGSRRILVDQRKVAVGVGIVDALHLRQGYGVDDRESLSRTELEVLANLLTSGPMKQLPRRIGQIQERVSAAPDQIALIGMHRELRQRRLRGYPRGESTRARVSAQGHMHSRQEERRRCFSRFAWISSPLSPSELDSKRGLHLPRWPRRCHLSERRVDLLARRIEAGGRIDRGVLRVVEHVVGLPSELQLPARCTAQRDVLEQRMSQL